MINIFVLYYYLLTRRRRDVYDRLIKIRGATVRKMGFLGAATPGRRRASYDGFGQGHGNRPAPERASVIAGYVHGGEEHLRAGAASREEKKPPEGIEPPLRGLKPRVLPLDQSGLC